MKPWSGFLRVGVAISALMPHITVVCPTRTVDEPSAVVTVPTLMVIGRTSINPRPSGLFFLSKKLLQTKDFWIYHYNYKNSMPSFSTTVHIKMNTQEKTNVPLFILPIWILLHYKLGWKIFQCKKKITCIIESMMGIRMGLSDNMFVPQMFALYSKWLRLECLNESEAISTEKLRNASL